MLRRLILNFVDLLLGWRSWSSGAVRIGQGTTLALRRIRHVAGNELKVGDKSIVHADITFEDIDGSITIGSRTFVGRSRLVCYRRINIGDDVIMSWGITVVDHDSHSLEWTWRKDDVSEWSHGRKSWGRVAHAPITICDKVWIGFNVSILKGVTIGEGAVIGACSVVTRSVPPYCLAVGNPAKVVRMLRS